MWKPDLNSQNTISSIPMNALYIKTINEDKVSSVTWNNQVASTLAVGYNSGEIIIWDVEVQKPIRTYTNHEQRVGSLDWLGPLLTSGSRDKSIISRDLRCPCQTIFKWEYHKQEVCGVSWSPEGCGMDGLLASGGNDNLLLIWRLGYDQPILAAVKAIAWSPFHAGILATGGGTNDRSVRLWDIKTNNFTKNIDAATSNVKAFTDTGSQVI
ncbi:uncharacterized protein LOC133320730 [Danaus plexippus]|uniref:uncharacterized protein LOC133320729 n=1 Tax=Danaus plexippus TaxID=13037 RepID=UPI002AB27CCD|nr:uncharacterized protein LOC133320729 [Danaus plexippus]XP_061385312.1 uncharacterized protein LOC133320730 [Danaus plexippus]